jgi:hypothetical protein
MRGEDNIVVLLLLFTVVSPNQVIGSTCTTEQKVAILKECDEYIKPGYPLILPSYVSVCCHKVRDVPNRDMNCIVDLLTPAEKATHGVDKIKRLKDLCDNSPAGLPNQVIKILRFIHTEQQFARAEKLTNPISFCFPYKDIV